MSAQDEEQSHSVGEQQTEGDEEAPSPTQVYDEDRPTRVLPGTGGTVTGTAINDWLDDEGNPKAGEQQEPSD
jgi:hypothetical protein